MVYFFPLTKLVLCVLPSARLVNGEKTPKAHDSNSNDKRMDNKKEKKKERSQENNKEFVLVSDALWMSLINFTEQLSFSYFSRFDVTKYLDRDKENGNFM